MAIVSLLLIVVTVIFSYRGFHNRQWYDAGRFEVDKILVNKEYRRFVTSGFLHVGWAHLLFNMVSLYFFSGNVELYIGGLQYLLIYFTSLIGGNLFALLVHRRHAAYGSVGASGAVCGIIFASIALFPGMSVSFFGLPLAIPAWLYGLAFVLISIYGVKSRAANVGYDAHLGGALVGLLVAVVLHPGVLLYNYFAIAVIALPVIVFIYIIITRPGFLLVDNHFFKTHGANYTIDQRFNLNKAQQQKEVDRILEKIHRKGMDALTEKERWLLDEYSRM